MIDFVPVFSKPIVQRLLKSHSITNTTTSTLLFLSNCSHALFKYDLCQLLKRIFMWELIVFPGFKHVLVELSQKSASYIDRFRFPTSFFFRYCRGRNFFQRLSAKIYCVVWLNVEWFFASFQWFTILINNILRK